MSSVEDIHGFLEDHQNLRHAYQSQSGYTSYEDPDQHGQYYYLTGGDFEGADLPENPVYDYHQSDLYSHDDSSQLHSHFDTSHAASSTSAGTATEIFDPSPDLIQSDSYTVATSSVPPGFASMNPSIASSMPLSFAAVPESDGEGENGIAAIGSFPCELGPYELCGERFVAGQFEEWLAHQKQHYNGRLPPKAHCWFCGHIFDARRSLFRGDCERQYDERMRHIYDDHLLLGDHVIRIDYFLADHLFHTGLISADELAVIRNIPDEIPLPDGTFMPVHQIPGADSLRRGARAEARRRERLHGAGASGQVIVASSRSDERRQRKGRAPRGYHEG